MNDRTLLWLAGGGVAALFLLSSKPSGRPNVIPNPVPNLGGARAFVVQRALLEHARVNALPEGQVADPGDYWAVAAPGVHLSPQEIKHTDWCGGFYLAMVKAAGLGPDVDWRFDGTGLHGALPPTGNPKPGDLAYFHRSQHHAMVEDVDGDDVHIINGNGGGKGITRSTVRRSQVAGFFSIEPLMIAAGVV